MSFHSVFKQILNESSFAKRGRKSSSMNEASDMLSSEDLAIGALTRNNILPSVFGGEYNGLRVPSALLKGEPVPVWNDIKYTTYPFVGINGYDTTAAKTAKQGNERSFSRGRLKNIDNSMSSIRQILDKQVSEGTGIPANVFVLFPQMPITSVGTGSPKRSQSNFVIFNKRDTVSDSLYPYNVQQALNVDANGKLYPDPNKAGGMILRPMRNGGGFLYADRLSDNDLYRLAYLNSNHAIFAEQVTGSSNPMDSNVYSGCMLKSYISGAHPDMVEGGNPDYFNFGKFAKNNGFETEDGKIDVLGIRRWILDSDAGEIVERLIKPYLLITPFEKTYCWRILGPEKRFAAKNDIRVYKALLGLIESNGGSIEQSIKDIESDSYEFDDYNDVGSEQDVQQESTVVTVNSVDDVSKMLNETSDSTRTINEKFLRDELMAIFNRYVTTHQNTIGIAPKKRSSVAMRDDNRIVTKSSGVKKTFARIITDNTPLMDIDYKFCPKSFDGMKTTYSGVLDFTPLFKNYSDKLDMSMPTKFKFTRIVGYMISYEYDQNLEDEYKRTQGKGKDRSLGKLKYYAESPNSVKLREPTVFDVIYVRGGEYGDFLFSSYAKPQDANIKRMNGEPPQNILTDKLYADNVDGLHSIVTHDFDRINIAYGYNTEVH